MAITMQGNWTVSVKSKNASFPQRFIIAGAASGNGTHNGDVGTPAVNVTGANWIIRVQHNPGTGFIDSDEQIKFPTTTGTALSFDIQSNDSGADQDFDDLVLTCSMPRTATDFVLYGNASWYKGKCLFNPCNRRWIVIDSVFSLKEALANPVLRKPIEALYPERLQEEPPRIGPTPPPPPFRPMVLPFEDVMALPAKQAQLVRLGVLEPEGPDPRPALPPGAIRPRTVAGTRTVTLSRPVAFPDLQIDRVAVARLVDQFFPLCQTGPLPGTVLRFLEYDRTATELAGGPYTGTGTREVLGVCATDRNGNYLFRFSRSISDFIHETNVDVAAGEDEVVQSMPDIIVQVVDPSLPTGFSYESAPYWNVPLIKRINICTPERRVPAACQGQRAIQAIGNIFMGVPVAGGARVGFNNFLTPEGRITAKNSLPDVPQARCAAWAGALDFFACFIDHPEVKHYTIRYRKHGTAGWTFFQEKYIHPKIANIALPNYSGDPVGPFDVPLRVDGGPPAPTKAYINIENDNDWVLTHRIRKAVISSWLYAGDPEPPLPAESVDFRIEGYDAAGNKVAAADDTITLCIDNSAPDFRITEVTMAGAPGGDCALFTVPAASPGTPLTVRFKANQRHGFMSSYGLSVRKGNIGGMPITGAPGVPPGQISGSYVHGDDLACSEFFGTFDGSGTFGLVVADVTPAGGRWLEPGQPFCTFAVNLGCSTRVTNGYNTAEAGYGPVQYLLGIQAGS